MDRFKTRGVAIAVVSFAPPEVLARYQDGHRWPFAMLADPARAVYGAFELKRLSWMEVFSPATLKLYWRLLRHGTKREDYGREDIYQSGGDFLIDHDGYVLYAHRSKDPADRPSAEKLLANVDSVIGAGSSPQVDSRINRT